MTKKEKQTQIALGTYLPIVWAESCKLYDEGWELYNKGLRDFMNFRIDNPLSDTGRALVNKGGKLKIRGRNMFSNAVKEVYGEDMEINWISDGYTNYWCKLSNGQEFKR